MSFRGRNSDGPESYADHVNVRRLSMPAKHAER